MISIIISTHNQGAGLIKTLVALEKQTHKDFEVIIVDRHSTDDIQRLLDQYRRLCPPFSVVKIESKTISKSKSINEARKSANGSRYLVLDPGETPSVDFLKDYCQGTRLVVDRKVGEKIRTAVVNDHTNQLGGGTVHSFKFIEFLQPYCGIDLYTPNKLKSRKWMKKYLNLVRKGVNLIYSSEEPEDGYEILFNISHWRLAKTKADKKFALIFFPQYSLDFDGYHLLANSSYTKKNIYERWGAEMEEVTVVYPPVMVDQFFPGEKENIILNVARFATPAPEASKGQKIMIKAFQKLVDNGLKDWRLVFIGQVQEKEFYYELLEKAQGYPIRFIKSPNFAELKDYYSRAKIYWQMCGVDRPRQKGAQEHFGITLVEAMASGAVPVSLNRGGPLEIVDDDKNGFLIDGIVGLIKKTKQLIDNPNLLERMSALAIKKAPTFNEEESKKDFYSAVFKTDKVSIIILCHNNLKFTRKCLATLERVTPLGYELILVDNASSDDTKQYLKEYAKTRDYVKLIFNQENYSFAKANNQAAEKSTKEYVLYLNNDTELMYGWLSKMVGVLENNLRAGIVGARMYYQRVNPENQWMIQHAGVAYDKEGNSYHLGHHQPDGLVSGDGVEIVQSVTGACLLVRRKLAKFSEIYDRGYYEDNELCLSLKEKGWLTYIHHEANLIHHEGKTQDLRKKKSMKEYEKTTEKNRRLFLSRWKKKLPTLFPEIWKK